MPIESRLFVKTSLVALVLAFVWGAALAVAEALAVPFAPVLAVEHAHLAFVGWLVNVVIGIAFWMLPLARDAFPDTAGRYPRRLPYLVYGLLNGGLVARIVSEPLLARSAAAGSVLIAAGVAQALAVLLFAVIAWQRVRAAARPAPGVR